MEILRRLHPVNLQERTAQWRRQEGWTGSDANAVRSTPASSTATTTRSAQEQVRSTTRVADTGARTRRVEGQEEIAIPVVEEDLTIGKREVERGHVRIFSRVTEQPVEESVHLREEKVTVERRPVDRPATDADFAAAEKEVIELTETAEEPVVSKRARVVEEVVVQKEVAEHTETVRGTERHTDVDVQREPGTATEHRRGTAPQDFVTSPLPEALHHGVCRRGGLSEYEPAYRYGYELGTNERYGGRTGRRSKPTPAATGKRATPTPGTASKTPSAMAGTKSARGPRLRTRVSGPLPARGCPATWEACPAGLLWRLPRRVRQE